jgi:hypothetical protein
VVLIFNFSSGAVFCGFILWIIEEILLLKKCKINIQHLQSGVYLVKLVSENQVVYSSNIIKE